MGGFVGVGYLLLVAILIVGGYTGYEFLKNFYSKEFGE